MITIWIELFPVPAYKDKEGLQSDESVRVELGKNYGMSILHIHNGWELTFNTRVNVGLLLFSLAPYANLLRTSDVETEEYLNAVAGLLNNKEQFDNNKRMGIRFTEQGIRGAGIGPDATGTLIFADQEVLNKTFLTLLPEGAGRAGQLIPQELLPVLEALNIPIDRPHMEKLLSLVCNNEKARRIIKVLQQPYILQPADSATL